ncbi:OSB1, mitochondrial-like protein [Drosera capensis]
MATTTLTTPPVTLLSPNPDPNSHRLPPSLHFTPHTTRPLRISCSVSGYKEPYVPPAPGAYPPPAEIPWKKEICNNVQLIGNLGLDVQITQFMSGKVVASTRLAVKKSANDTTWINLTFWDELAHVAYQHLKKGQQIYVSGRLVADTVEGDEGKSQTYYKVVVQELNLVERNFTSPVDLYDSNYSSMDSGGNVSGNGKLSVEELWQAFFANPTDWWDNRTTKRNPRGPDFKHKDTGEALWVDSRYNPPWVQSQLEILDKKLASLNQEQSRQTNQFDFLDGGSYASF